MKKRMYSRRLPLIVSSALVCMAGFMTIKILAAPSITSLHGKEEQTVVNADSNDGTNTASLLSEEDIYTSEALSVQYMVKNESGTLVDTPVSEVIDLGADTLETTGENGNPIPEDIATVEEMINDYCKAADVDESADSGQAAVDLKNLDQITYWLDFKYESTDYRVIAGDKIERQNRVVELDNGMLEAEIDGGEVIRAANPEDYVIIQIDAKTKELHYLTMKEYDEDTGRYVVEFPCIGPYMVTQVMYD